MTFDELVAHFGTLTLAAKALRAPLSTVSEWRNGIPIARQYEIQVLTGGALRAEPRPAPPSHAEQAPA